MTFSMIHEIFGRSTVILENELVLGFLVTLCNLVTKACPKYDFSCFISNKIHTQLIDYGEDKSFWYQSYLVSHFIDQNYRYLEDLKLNMVNEKKIIMYVFKWIPLVRGPNNNKGLLNYVSSLMPVVYNLLHSEPFPRVPKFLRDTS